MERRIAFLTVPDLEVAIARSCEPSLRNWPAAIVPKHHKQPVLWQVSAEAREVGVVPGMPLRRAQRLCPGIRIIAPDSRRIAKVHELLQRVFQQFSPIHEIAGDQDFYVDLSESGPSFDDAAGIASRIRREIAQRYGLTGTMGVSVNKLVAHVAADYGGARFMNAVPPGDEASFLSPLPFTSLPGITHLLAPRTNAMLTLMDELCLRRLGQLAAISMDQLQLVIGGKARFLKQWSLGIDRTPVWPQSAAPMVQRWISLATATIDDEVLLAVIYRIVERVCSYLRRAGRLLGVTKLFLQYADGGEFAKTHRFDPPTCWESEVFPRLREGFLSIDRRVRVRSIGVIASSVSGPRQLDLFPGEARRRWENLGVGLDGISSRHGEHAVSRGMNKSSYV